MKPIDDEFRSSESGVSVPQRKKPRVCRQPPMRSVLVSVVVWIGCFSGTGSQAEDPSWEVIETTGQPTARHEASFVSFRDQLYLIGGRRINPVDVFDPMTRTWTEKSRTPMELHHFQAVVVDDAIYLMGAMTGGWPTEQPLEKIVVYHPDRDEFEFKHSIPEARRRGGAGAAYHRGKIYLVGGITNGHMNGYVPWLDQYDPETGDWRVLPDAPHARDHFQAVVIDDHLYAVAGRTTSHATGEGFDLTVPEVDVFDLKTQRWQTDSAVPDLPTPRAGNMAIGDGHHLIVGGGESATQKSAHADVEVYDTETQTWKSWPSLRRGRHGSGFGIVDGYLYTASGSGNRGGGPELTTVERLKLPQQTSEPAGRQPVHLYHPIELSFQGPMTGESASPNPFTDYRLTVEFRRGDQTRAVRGFYAADGDAANTGATRGKIWKVRFAPDMTGKWTYAASLRTGTDIATSDDQNAGEPVLLGSGAKGSLTVQKPGGNETSESFYDRGRIVSDGTHFRFAGGEPWLKGGCNSPENLLAYVDFDDTYRTKAEARDGEAAAPKEIHQYQPHVNDWREGDPTWAGGKGKALIGGVNYLADQGINSMYFLTMNIGGDGKDVWPYRTPEEFTRFDCSKLDQWNVVFTHMQRRGILLHVVTQETENERMLDDGDTGRLRKLYYRELIARFGHHPALVWNLGEENGPADFSPHGQTGPQQRAMASYLKQHDPYGHPVLIHTHSTPSSKDHILPDLLGHRPLDGLSFQVNRPEDVHREILRWTGRSRQAGRPWLITMDEIGKWDTGAVPDSVDPDHDKLRRHVLWGTLLAGGAGVEWYFGAHYPHNDLTNEDWRERDRLWKQTTIARKFFEEHLPYTQMQPHVEFIVAGGLHAFAEPGKVYAIYRTADDAKTQLKLTEKGTYRVRWFDPVAGGELRAGSVSEVTGEGVRSLGDPPSDAEAESDLKRDWVILVERK